MQEESLDLSGEFQEEFRVQHADAVAELQSICPGHDDYIWIGTVNSQGNPVVPIGPAVHATYYARDRSREDRSDEIFEEVVAPNILDQGHIATWGFFAHRSGGIFRRLEAFSGADHKTLLNLQDTIYAEASETNPVAMNEFTQICNWHADYMWNNATQQ